MENRYGSTEQLNVCLNEDTLERLFLQQWSKLVRCVCRMVRCKEAASDIAQEAYLRVAESAEARTIISPRAFLFRIAKNLAIDYLRKQKTHLAQAATLNHAVHLPAAMPSLERAVMDKQRFNVFLTAVEGLPPRCREVFILHRMHDMSYGEIATRLQISESGVEKHIMRALAHCRKALQQQAGG